MPERTKLLDAESWKAASDTDRAGVGLVKAVAFGVRGLTDAEAAEVKDLGGDPSMTVPFTLSDESRDRDGDRIMQAGWDLEAFKSNPVVLFAHKYDTLPIGKCIKAWVGQSTDKGPQLKAYKQFTRDDQNPVGATAHKLLTAGFLNACSVGFKPSQHEPDTLQPGEPAGTRPGYKFLKQQLLESSVVPVPSNPNALHDAKSVAGIDLSPLVPWCESLLDTVSGAGLWVPRKALEDARIIAKGSGPTLTFISPGVEPEAKAEPEPVKKTAIPYARNMLAPPDTAYSEASERSEAASTDPGLLYWMAAVFDSSKPEDPASYQLLHHRAADLATVFAGVQSAMASCLGGGVSEDERPLVYQHLANHYRDFAQEPPELKAYAPAELKALFGDAYKEPKASPMGAAIGTPEAALAALNGVADYLFTGPDLTPEQAMRIDNAIDLADGAVDLILDAMGAPDPGDDDDEGRSASQNDCQSKSEPEEGGEQPELFEVDADLIAAALREFGALPQRSN